MSEKKEYSLDHITQVGNWSIYTTGTALFLPQLLQSLLSSNEKVLQQISIGGVLTKPIDELKEFLSTNGGRLVVSKKTGDYVYVWPDGSYINVDFAEKSKGISISGYATDQKVMDLVPTLEKEFTTKVKTNLIFSIIRTSSGLEIRSMGDGSSPLIKENYLPEVLEDVDYIISSFTKSPPGGRIAILNGEPGTGKTHLIRSILTRMDCVFLIIPSNLIDSLDKPEFMPLLLNVKNEHDKPVVMIIEDGDTCLVPRKSDNISTISALLNLSDGILGSIIDIKMIISTNAEIRDMDQAIMRPGRLCRNVHVGPLPYEQARKVYERLMKDVKGELPYKKFYTLAEVYDMVNNVDFVNNTKHSGTYNQSRRVIGFNSRPAEQDLTVNSTDLKIK
jgi:hypothetical protein